MFLSLGNITFQGIKLPQSWDGSFETNYSQIAIIGNKPVVQGIGEKLNEYDLTALFHVEFCNPRDEVDALQAIRKAGEVNYLVDGTGRNYGKFVITTISESKSMCLDNGFPIAISVSIHLLEYNTNSSFIKQSGSALTSQNPLAMDKLSPKLSAGGAIALDIKNGSQMAAKLSGAISNNPTPSNGMLTKITAMVKSANETFTNANNKIEDTKKIVNRAMDLKNSIVMVKDALTLIKQASEIKNFNDLMSANVKLTQSMYFLNNSYSPVAAFIGSREGGE